ncbi:3'-5' exonuclease [Bacillus sp. B6(2022)]|nr:3'-5' exonuclease [Bacillus sp. B6(2022)]
MSKGLEFDVVFIIGLTQGTFPDYRVKTDVQRQEELNNMFVAVTRAKRECYLTYPENKMMPWGTTKRQQPSEYLNIITE